MGEIMAKIIITDELIGSKTIAERREPARWRDLHPVPVKCGDVVEAILKVNGEVLREVEYIVPVDPPIGKEQVANLKLETVYWIPPEFPEEPLVEGEKGKI
jgi:hypothetical protein